MDIDGDVGFMLQRYLETLSSYAESSYDSSVIGEHELRLVPDTTMNSREASELQDTSCNSSNIISNIDPAPQNAGSERQVYSKKASGLRPSAPMERQGNNPGSLLPNSDPDQKINPNDISGTEIFRQAQIDSTEAEIEKRQANITNPNFVKESDDIEGSEYSEKILTYSEVKPKYFTGIFNASKITSSQIFVITADIIRSLNANRIRFLQIHGGFLCIDTGQDDTSGGASIRALVEFYIFVIKVPLISLHGIRFKRVMGPLDVYKERVTCILTTLRL